MRLKTKLLCAFSTLFMVIMLTACSEQDMETSANLQASTEMKDGNATSMSLLSTTYYSTPTAGNYVPNSSIGIGGSCGVHLPLLRAYMLTATGSSFTVRISLQSGAGFGYSGTGYLKEGSLCGPIGGSATFTGVNLYVDVTITPSFTQGVKHYYPLVVLSNGSRYYAEPILIYTSPMYSTAWTYGNVLGTVNNVDVKCNATSTNLSLSNTYQCTEFCERYYSSVYANGFSYSHAYTWFGTAGSKGLVAYVNNGSTAPRPGDILCLSGGATGPGAPAGYGHVAIIIEVGSTYIKVAQQNTGTNTGIGYEPIGGVLPRSGNFITAPPNTPAYAVQGWIRKA